MSNDHAPKGNVSTPTTTSNPEAVKPQAIKSRGKRGKPKKVEAKVPVTFAFTPDFSRKLKVVVSGLDQSSSEYVESRLSAVVSKDLKKILEELA